MIAKVLLRLDARQYWSNAWESLVFQDVFMGLVKPVLFGFIIATMGCFYGMNARGGTQGVGRATTQAVVAASVLILVVRFVYYPIPDGRRSRTTNPCLRQHCRSNHAPTPSENDSAPAIVFEDVAMSFEENQVCAGFPSVWPAAKPRHCSAWPDRERADSEARTRAHQAGLGAHHRVGAGRHRDAGRRSVHLRGKIGMVFQESALFDSLTVRENVAYRLMEEHGVYDDEIDRRVREALRFVELEHTLDLFPSELSGGMRRRVAIARAHDYAAGVTAL